MGLPSVGAPSRIVHLTNRAPLPGLLSPCSVGRWQKKGWTAVLVSELLGCRHTASWKLFPSSAMGEGFPSGWEGGGGPVQAFRATAAYTAPTEGLWFLCSSPPGPPFLLAFPKPSDAVLTEAVRSMDPLSLVVALLESERPNVTSKPHQVITLNRRVSKKFDSSNVDDDPGKEISSPTTAEGDI